MDQRQDRADRIGDLLGAAALRFGFSDARLLDLQPIYAAALEAAFIDELEAAATEAWGPKP